MTEDELLEWGAVRYSNKVASVLLLTSGSLIVARQDLTDAKCFTAAELQGSPQLTLAKVLEWLQDIASSAPAEYVPPGQPDADVSVLVEDDDDPELMIRI